MRIAILLLLLFAPEAFGAGQARQDSPAGAPLATADLPDTYWKLTHLGDAAVNLSSEHREPHLVLRSEDHRVGGHGGCNRITGSYVLDRNRVNFSDMASTMMACAEGMDIERSFLETLERVKTWKITGEQLELFDADDRPLARFEARYLR